MIDGSWVVSDRETGKSVLETFDFETLQFINLKRYRVWTILAWLGNVQHAINAGEDWVKG